MRSTPVQHHAMRFAAFLIDAAILTAALLVAGNVLGWIALRMGTFGPPLVRAVWIGIWAAFVVLFLVRDALPAGTFGRRIIGLRVVGKSGAHPSVGESIRRNVLLLIPIWNIWEALEIGKRSDGRRGGDRWAGTHVEEE